MRTLSILIIAFIAGLFFTCAQAEAADWKFYTETQNLDIEFYYDTETVIKVSKDIVRVQQKQVYKTEQLKEKMGSYSGGKPVEYSIGLTEINCANKMTNIVKIADYDKNGNEVGAFDAKTEVWENIIPGSTIEVLYNVVCQ